MMILQMAFCEVSLTGINDRAAKSSDQYQTTHMCSLILPYPLCKLIPLLYIAGKWLGAIYDIVCT